MRTKALTIASMFAAVSLVLITSPSYAQESATSIEEIVVTARKRAENLQEVPIAVTFFAEKMIERAGIERPAEFGGSFIHPAATAAYGLDVVFRF